MSALGTTDAPAAQGPAGLLARLGLWPRPAAVEVPPMSVEPVAERASDPVPEPAYAATMDPDLADLVQRWQGLSATHRKVILALCGEIGDTSQLVETKVVDLSRQFRELASTTQAQSDKLQEVIAATATVKCEDREVDTAEVIQIIDGRLGSLMAQIVQTSKHSVSVVYSLDDVVKDLGQIEQLISDVERINKQTNLLALNARIEASRAGDAGKGFGVVAHEVQALSKAMNQIAERMRSGVGQVSSGIRTSHATVRESANVDMTDVIIAREEIVKLMQALLAQYKGLTVSLGDAMQISREASAVISRSVVDMQFQDRATQRLQNVVDALATLEAALEGMQESSASRSGLPNGVPDEAWLRGLIAQRSLGEMRERFITAMLLDGVAPPEAPVVQQSGDVELF
jgi:methyl-accepting chemotaxis protein